MFWLIRLIAIAICIFMLPVYIMELGDDYGYFILVEFLVLLCWIYTVLAFTGILDMFVEIDKDDPDEFGEFDHFNETMEDKDGVEKTWTCSHCGFTCKAGELGGPREYHDCKTLSDQTTKDKKDAI